MDQLINNIYQKIEAIDHIYLFNNIQEIRDIITGAEFEISSEVFYSSEDVSPERAAKFKIA